MATFTRQHMVASAEAVRDATERAYHYADNFREGDRAYRQGIECAIEEVRYALADMFREANPRFDMTRFLKACGSAREEVA
jgi:hypothetical protein